MTTPEAEPLTVGYLFDGYFDTTQGVPNYVDTLGDYMREQGHEIRHIVGGSQQVEPHISVIGRTLLRPI